MLLWQNQVITEPETFAQIVDIPVDAVSPQRAYDMTLARNENLEIASESGGVAIMPNSWDEHAVHIREHNNYRKTHEFRELNDDTKTKFEFHVNKHEEFQIESLKKEARKALIMQGQDPEAMAQAAQGEAQAAEPAPGEPPAEQEAPPEEQ